MEVEHVPLRLDESGTLRVGATRVTLDVMLQAYALGASAEDLVEQFPTLSLADVYSVLGYYLRHPGEIDREYLIPRKEQADAMQREWESRNDPRATREALMTRRSQRG